MPTPPGDYENDPKTRQGNPYSMRYRICGATKVTRRIRYPGGVFAYLHYCTRCDHIPLRSKG